MENSNSDITVVFSVYEIFVRETLETLQLQNVVEKIVWKAVLTKNTVSTSAMGDVILDPPQSVQNFISINELSEQQVIDWVIVRLGGDVFVENLKLGHAPHLDKLEYEASLKRWTNPLIGQAQVPGITLSQAEIDNMIAAINNG
jgi:hypothetical protein